MTDRRPVLHLKPAEPSATVGSAKRLVSLIDGAGRQHGRIVRPEKNMGKILRAAIPDLVLRQSVADTLRASGYSVSASPTSAVAFRLMQIATMPSADAPPCSKCGAEPRRGQEQSWGLKCHSEYQNARRARRDQELQKRRDMMTGLVVE
jgi:hypothetical protein